MEGFAWFGIVGSQEGRSWRVWLIDFGDQINTVFVIIYYLFK